MINLPQQTITGLLNGRITRVFKVCDPQPDGIEDGAFYRWKESCIGLGNYKQYFRPMPKHEPPGTTHTIGGQQFEVVESGVKQYSDITDIDFMEAGYPPETMTGHSQDWYWTAEYRRKDDDE